MQYALIANNMTKITAVEYSNILQANGKPPKIVCHYCNAKASFKSKSADGRSEHFFSNNHANGCLAASGDGSATSVLDGDEVIVTGRQIPTATKKQVSKMNLESILAILGDKDKGGSRHFNDIIMRLGYKGIDGKRGGDVIKHIRSVPDIFENLPHGNEGMEVLFWGKIRRASDKPPFWLDLSMPKDGPRAGIPPFRENGEDESWLNIIAPGHKFSDINYSPFILLGNVKKSTKGNFYITPILDKGMMWFHIDLETTS